MISQKVKFGEMFWLKKFKIKNKCLKYECLSNFDNQEHIQNTLMEVNERK